MALPTLQKTWQIDPNLFVMAAGTTDHMRAVLKKIKDALIGFSLNPLTVAGSSDSSTAGMDATDRWVSNGNLIWNTGSHSWIVLERVDGIQICFDLNYSAATSMDVYVSQSGGFTGGSTTNRPTASDEFNSVQWADQATSSTSYWGGFYNTLDGTCRFHVWNSTDGLCQRVVGLRRANTQFFWRFEIVKDPPDGFSPAFIASMVSQDSGDYREGFTSTYFLDVWGYGVQYKKGACRPVGIGTVLYNTANRGEWPATSWASVAEEMDGLLQMTEVVYFSRTGGTIGLLGSSYDLWVTNEAIVKNGDSFPDDPDDRQFTCAGCLVLPWTGDSTVMLTS
jgi:hypothetical protein